MNDFPRTHRSLVVRPAPYTGESLASYAARLAAANHISITELMGGYFAPNKFRYGHDDAVQRLHEVTDLPSERLKQMAHPERAIANKGFLGIRTRGQVICHNCHGEDGIRLLEWDHPLVTVCVYCQGLLAPKDWAPRHEVPGRWLLNDLLEVRDMVLHRDEMSKAAWDRIVLLTRMGKVVARNMTSTWPSSRYKPVRMAARSEAAAMKVHPSRRQVTSPPSFDLALVTIATCWDYTLDPIEADRFLRTRIRADKYREAKRLREIEQGRAEVAAWSERSARRTPPRPAPWPWPKQ